jgi:hypothetical protein
MYKIIMINIISLISHECNPVNNKDDHSCHKTLKKELSGVCTGKIYCKNSHNNATTWTMVVLVLTALGDMTQIGLFLFVRCIAQGSQGKLPDFLQ